MDSDSSKLVGSYDVFTTIHTNPDSDKSFHTLQSYTHRSQLSAGRVFRSQPHSGKSGKFMFKVEAYIFGIAIIQVQKICK